MVTNITKFIKQIDLKLEIGSLHKGNIVAKEKVDLKRDLYHQMKKWKSVLITEQLIEKTKQGKK